MAIANPKDKEEFALPLNGKRSRLGLGDFLKASSTMGIEERVTLQLIGSMRKALPAWEELVRSSFLKIEKQEAYMELITERLNVLKGL